MASLDVLVGRQPIFAGDRTVFGYELLFRPLPEVDAPAGDTELLTSSTLLGVPSGLEPVIGNRLAFVDAARLTGLAGDVERVVVEVPAGAVPADEALADEALAAGRRARAQGFRVALDGFEWSERAEPLLDLAALAKIDLHAHAPDELPGLLDRCRCFGVQLVAENVHGPADLRRAEELGFDYFQGFFLPGGADGPPGRTLDASDVSQVQLAAALMDEEFHVAELERILRTDPSLSVQVMQLAGSGGAHGLRRTVRTLREALVLLGWQRLQSWVAFLVLIQRGSSDEDQVAIALARARMAELLAERTDRGAAGLAFAAGMFSALDLLTGDRLEDILAALPLADDLREAALARGTGTGRVVRAVLAYETDPDSAGSLPEISPAELHGVAGRALAWAVHATQPVVAA